MSRLAPLLAAAMLGLTACAGTSPTTVPSTRPSNTAATPAPAAFPPIDEEGCEHLAEGPAAPVNGAAKPDASAPAIADDHKRYDVSLAGGGFVKFQSGGAKEYVFFTSPAATVAITDATGKPVALTSSTSGSKACDDIKSRHTAKLGVGVYYLELKSSGAKVSVVVEDANAVGGED
jgi:hypothetical protein